MSKYSSAEFVARLNEVIAVKRLAPKAVHEKTGIPYDQLDRLGKGPRGPSAAKLRAIVLGLELDADFLLDTDERYRRMTAPQKAAHMALDRYLMRQARLGVVVGPREVDRLRHVADYSRTPPLWSADWEVHHERMRVSALVTSGASRSASVGHGRGRRRLRS